MRRFLIILSLLTLLLAFNSTAFAQGDSAGEDIIHIVQSGENLYRISLRYGVAISAIQTANGITNRNLIFVGQRLVIPQGAGPTPTPVPTQPPAGGDDGGGNPAPPTSGESFVYTVVRGDTLGRIARRFGTTVNAIVAANGITNPNIIYPGQQLTIPGSSGVDQPVVVNPGTPTPGGFGLGGHVLSFAYPGQMRGAGMTWVKKQLVWTQGQPASVAQGIIDEAAANGFTPLIGVVGSTSELGANRAQYIQDLANFLGGVAALMTNGGAIEVWNEPNIDRQWPNGQISGAAYTEMLRAAYNAIKAQNPNILVISGAPAPTGVNIPGAVVSDDIFIRDMARSGAASVMDCVGIHYNEGILPPTARSGDPRGNSGHYSRYYPAMVSLYSGVFPGLPLCFTELGYLSGEGYGPLPEAFAWAGSVTVADQAEWLAQVVTLARNSGRVRLLIIWNVDFTIYGDDPQAGYAIVRPNGQCPACVTMGAAMGVN